MDHSLQIEELFHAALEVAPAGRGAFLAQACGGNHELLREVESLLAFDDRAGLLQSLVDDVAREIRGGPALKPGTRAGSYVIQSEIGHGGMGTVYLAARADGQFEQEVALKVIGGASTPAGVERFLTERQLLANLQHPHIAALLDGGTTADGHPYFAMEYLKGESITAYFARLRPDVVERVRVFEQVCGAIHYAHQKLVIHRDLKPSNILITAEGVAKILDFGIAQLIGAATQEESRAMTPAYASPELLRGNMVSTASDIYSLGVVLKEILAGERLDSDLESIVRMATAPEPERRYGSAQAMAEDLRRYRHGFPVRAHRGGWMYRAGCLVSRHRVAAFVAGALLISWLIGTVVVVRQSRVTEQRAKQVRDLADMLLFDFNGASATPGNTENRAAMVKRALDNLGQLARSSENDPSLDLQMAIAYERVGEAQGDPLTRSLGDSAGAERSYKAALAMLDPLPPSVPVMHERMRVLLKLGTLRRDAGGMPDAKAAFLKAAELADAALKQAPAALNQAPKDAEVRSDAGLVFESLARALTEMGSYKDVARPLDRAFTEFRQLLMEDPTNREYRNGLANCYGARMTLNTQLGHFQESLADARENLRLRESIVRDAPGNFDARRNLMLAYARVGDILGYPVLGNLGDYRGAAKFFRQTLTVAESLTADDPSDRNSLSDRNMARMRLAITLTAAGERDEALPHLRTGLAETERLLKADPGHKRYLTNASTFHQYLADEATRERDFAGAQSHIDSGNALLEKVFARDAHDATAAMIGVDLLMARLHLEAARHDAADFARAEESLRAWSQRFVKASPRVLSWTYRGYREAGEIRAKMGDKAGARAWYEKSLQGWNDLQEKKLLPARFASEPARVAELIKAVDASKKDNAVKKAASGTAGSSRL